DRPSRQPPPESAVTPSRAAGVGFVPDRPGTGPPTDPVEGRQTPLLSPDGPGSRPDDQVRSAKVAGKFDLFSLFPQIVRGKMIEARDRASSPCHLRRARPFQPPADPSRLNSRSVRASDAWPRGATRP